MKRTEPKPSDGDRRHQQPDHANRSPADHGAESLFLVTELRYVPIAVEPRPLKNLGDEERPPGRVIRLRLASEVLMPGRAVPEMSFSASCVRIAGVRKRRRSIVRLEKDQQRRSREIPRRHAELRREAQTNDAQHGSWQSTSPSAPAIRSAFPAASAERGTPRAAS
jgi:hypothetical protein